MSVEETKPAIGYVLKMYPRFSETFIVSEILAREAAGERIVIFSMRPPVDPRFHPELARVQAPVIYIDRPASASKQWLSWQNSMTDPAIVDGVARALPELLRATHDDATQAIALAAAAQSHGVRHLHAHFASMATTIARLAALITGLPYSFTAHAKDIFHESVVHDELAAKLRDAHHVVTISDHNVRHLTNTFPAETNHLHRIYNGLELARFPYQPVRQSFDTPRLLAVGRLVEKKGFGLLIAAAAQLREQGRSVTVDLVGEGPMRAELEDQIAAANLVGTVRLLGPRTQQEVAEMLRSHDVFVAPFVIGSDGNVDGLPTVLLEAMASGIACVASDVTGVAEVIRAGETGWLTPSGDIAALTAAIGEALDDSARTRSYTDKARALVEDHFDSRIQAKNLAQLASLTRQEAS